MINEEMLIQKYFQSYSQGMEQKAGLRTSSVSSQLALCHLISTSGPMDWQRLEIGNWE